MTQLNLNFNLKRALLVPLLSPLFLFLAGRIRVLSLAYFNAAGRMPRHANFTSSEVKFADRIRSCEDVVLIESLSLALLACDPGRETWNTVMGVFTAGPKPEPNAELYAYNYSSSTLSDSESLKPINLVGFNSELRSLGLEYHEPSSTLFIANHGHQGSRIEQFHLDLDTLTATHKHTLTHPLIRSPNSITALSASEFFFTNQHYFTARDSPRILWALETYLALPIASIVHARVLSNGSLSASVVAHQAYPNGIALFNESTLAVASTNKRLVYFYSIARDPKHSHPTLQPSSTLWLPFLPDNLSISKADGALLIAGHPHLPSLNQYAHSRALCNRDGEAESVCASINTASWASEWTPSGGLQHIYADWTYPSSASVVRDREKGVGIVAGLYANGILVWRD
ncbi:hypothetical protein GGR50DRAFT_689088 [Xylaria sp. CBS 124048]|nr:hypothetical protein GGR50DRAFT_689088 [Xylaria sp. CBS 124048]